jgi:DNA-binding transcriptional LysR family regulator
MNTVGGVIGEDLVAPLVMAFQEQHPDVSVQVNFSSARVDLIENPFDLVIRMGELPDSSLLMRRLQTIRTRYVASPDFVAKHGAIIRPEDLEHVPLIYGSVDQWVLRRGTEQRVVKVGGGLNIASGRVMRRAAIAGQGVTRLADVYCQGDIDARALVEVLPAWSEQTQLSLVCPPSRHQLARVRALMDWIAARFDARYQAAMRGN